MISVFYDLNKLSKKCKFITFVDAFFFNHINTRELDELDKYFLEVIDNAEIKSLSTGLVETFEGLTSIYNISSGCKTLILANHIVKENLDICLDVTNCGENALYEIFDKFAETNLKVFLSYSIFRKEIKDVKVLMNGSTCCTLQKFCTTMKDALGGERNDNSEKIDSKITKIFI
jgi:hypothetical protein